MLDYPVFPGLGVWFALSLSRNAKLPAFRSDFLRWTVALSLLWPAMEKFVYPAWVAPIAVAHPELTLGFDVSTVVTAAGVVEFGLAFALFWTPLVRRLAALALVLVLTAATLDFGKVDGIGHLMIIAILFAVFADRDDRPARYRPALAPLVGSMALPATLLLYTGAHTLSYTSLTTPIEPLAGGTALLLLVIFLCLHRSRKVRATYATRAGRTSCAKSRAPPTPGFAPRKHPGGILGRCARSRGRRCRSDGCRVDRVPGPPRP